MVDDLFRREALEAQSASNEQFGRPTGVVPPAWSRITWLIGLFMIALLAFLLTANFARKETVRGKLRPVGAEARIYAQERGIISEVFVEDGGLVEAGAPLASITSDRVLSDGVRLGDEALASLRRERDLLTQRLEGVETSAEIAEADLDQRIRDANRQEADGRAQMIVLTDRLVAARQRAADTEEFLDEGLITAREHMDQVDAVSVLEQSRLQLQSQIGDAVAARSRYAVERRRIRSDTDRDTADLNQRLAQIDAQLRQTEASTSHIVTSPIDGRVSALLVRPGEPADPGLPIMTIGPPEPHLVAELYLPSRAIAFVEPGQAVKLQYDALPYQKFGVAQGHVSGVSSTSLLPHELGIQSQVTEPLYRVEVSIAEQSVPAFGQDVPLQSGMELSADIVLEDRKLVEWLLEPLRSVR